MTDQAEQHATEAASSRVTSFELAIPQADLDDLFQRLERTRWP